MNAEEKVFSRKRFVVESLLRFGFIKTDGGYRCETDFMNGDFSAILTVDEKGAVSGTVIDKMNGEEYRQLRIGSFQGAYVNSVRTAYEELLCHIADECCEDVRFESDQANRIAGLIAEKYGVTPDCPWEEDGYQSGVFRHTDNAKWFALIMNVKRRALLKNGDDRTFDVINLKNEPENIEKLTGRTGIYPAYHMNRKHWISVLLDESLSDDEVMKLVDESFCLTESKNGKKRRA